MKHGKKALKLAAGLLPLVLAAGLAGCAGAGDEAGREEGAGQLQTSGAEAGDLLRRASALDVFGEENGEEQSQESSPESDVPAQRDSEAAEEASGQIPPATVKERPQGWTLKLASEDWGLSFGEPGTVPVGNAAAQDLAWYDAYYVGEESEKVIYLTFDCGYENGNTQPILDALKKHQAPATFFVVGHFLETAPDMARRMVEDGHTVGNHTYHHPDMSAISDMEAFQKEMDDVAGLFREVTGAELSPFYRPPQGKCNTRNLEMAQELGYYTIFWSLAHVDWITDSQPGHDESIEKLTNRIHPGAVVLLHNTSSTNGEILDELLTKWEEMGYSFRPLAELVSG